MTKITKDTMKIISILCFLILGFMIMNINSQAARPPVAVDGYIDLSNYKLSENRVINLDGRWQVYPNKLLEPIDLISDYSLEKETINVPELWKEDKNKLKGKGVATYRLMIKTDKKPQLLGIKLENIKMASKVYINGKLLDQRGVVSSKVKQYKANNSPYTIFFYNEGNSRMATEYKKVPREYDIELVIQVANYDYINGGISNSISFGTANAIEDLVDMQNALDISGTVILMLFGVYHIAIYAMGKYFIDKSFLYNGLFFIMLSICVLANNERILLQVFYNDLGYLVYKLQHFFSIAVIIPFALFVRSMNKAFLSDKVNKLVYFITIPYLILVTVTPLSVYSSVKLFFLSFNQIIILIVLINSIRCLYKKDYGTLDEKSSVLFLASMLCLLVFPIISIVYNNNMLGDSIFLAFSFLGFIIFTAILLAYRFAATYRNSAKLSEDLIKSEKIRDEFMVKTSHELKTPIYGIINISHSLMQREFLNNMPKEKKDIMLINKAASRMSKLVGDISDFITLKDGKLRVEFNKVDLRICIDIVFGTFKYLIDKKRIDLINEVKENTFIYADENRIRQILYNLVESCVNSIEDGYIKATSNTFNDRTYINLEHNGEGLSEDEIEDIFSEQKNLSSLELGLLISKQLVEVMNGVLEVSNTKKSSGVQFILHIPTYKQSTKVNQRQKILIRKPIIKDEDEDIKNNLDVLEGHDFTILIVDDELSNIYVARNAFIAEGYNVLIAFSAEEAFKKLLDNSVDVMILDIMLSGVSGIEICRKVRENYNLIELPILITTASHKSDDILLGLEAGANDYLEKPFNEREVKARVRTLINMKKSVREALSSEMAFLHAQIKPHFLFNALSTIMSFCYTDGEKAASLIAQFSKYLRTVFDIDKDSIFTTIYNELDLVEAYVAIEKARFGELVSVKYDVDEKLTNCMIPSLTIQPLVENSIKHGIYNKEDGVTIDIKINEEQDKVIIEVFDTGVGIEKEKIEELLRDGGKKGVGIRNVYDRIKSIKGSEFNIESEEERYTKVKIKLPRM
ncbi:ATP-binding protein [Clostridium sp. C8-1-8]|uniref:ATP-binding protein n=1 Tax=Clostridium sp. C8-1-8 TaxID=2698831 RepID=UPI00136DDDF7|nr:ATP-binding protein [Clostridium sp. C8-1-8]